MLRRGLLPLVSVLLLLPGTAIGDEPLVGLLEAMVDARTPDARRQLADALADREDVHLEVLLDAMGAFGVFEVVEAGVHVEEVPLALRRIARTVVFVPATYDPEKPTPLIFALHGAGGRGAEMVPFWRTVAEELGAFVIAPTEAGDNEGFRFTSLEREDALAVLRWARRRYNIDENRIHLTGISRGGHLTWDLGVREPDRWASLAPMIGGPRLHVQEGQNNLRYIENVAHLPIRDLQGREDDARMIFNLVLAFERLNAAGAKDAELLLQSGYGHGFDFDAVDWTAFLSNARREPVPRRLVRRAVKKGEGRSAWLEVLDTKRPVAEEFELKVSPVQWNRLDDDGRRRVIQSEADKRTARVEARYEGAGRFHVQTRGVKRLRLLLTQEMLDAAGKVDVQWGARRIRRKVTPSKQVLLREFAERFDRTFLPVAELSLR